MSQHRDLVCVQRSSEIPYHLPWFYTKRRLDPSPGATLELGFLGSAFIVELPAGVDTQQALPSSALSRKNARRDAECQVTRQRSPSLYEFNFHLRYSC